MTQLAIKRHPTRGKEVIALLEMLGGKKRKNFGGNELCCWYYINENGDIAYKHYSLFNDTKVFTLEEFEEKFPYKVGDRVRVSEYESEVCISKMYWDGNEVQYEVVTDEVEWYSAKELNEFNEPNKKETAEDIIKIDIPKGYEFAGIDNQQVIFEKIGYQYPKTYEECCEVLFPTTIELGKVSAHGYNGKLLEKFGELLICRNAYWKIAGEQMGLGKPWEPDWNTSEPKYVIARTSNGIEKQWETTYCKGFAFPTKEMRDAFYENFKDLIMKCKELL